MKPLFFLLSALVISSCNSTGSSTSSTNTQQSATTTTITTAAPRSANATADLSIIVLPTSDGAQEDSDVQKFQYPTTATISTADTFGAQIAAYGAAYQVWIGPKGWTGKGGSGADGTVAVQLYKGTDSALSGPHIIFYDFPSCFGCILSSAAPYFPEAMKLYNENYNEENSNPIKVPKGLHINKVSPTLVTYSYPVKKGLLTQGVAYYTSSDSGDPYFAEAQFVFPESQSKLVEFLMNTYIIGRKLN